MTSKDVYWNKKFSSAESIAVFKTRESWKGSNCELYVDIKKHLELKNKRIKSIDNADRVEIYDKWIQKGYITNKLDQQPG